MRLFRKRAVCPAPRTPAPGGTLFTARLVRTAGTPPFVAVTVDEDAVPMDTPDSTRAAAAQYAALADRLVELAAEQQAAHLDARRLLADLQAIDYGDLYGDLREWDVVELLGRAQAVLADLLEAAEGGR